MRRFTLGRFLEASSSPSSSKSTLGFFVSTRRNVDSASTADEKGEAVVSPRNSYGLNWALARKGVIVKDKVFRNLKFSKFKQKGATLAESLSEVPVHVRGNILGGDSEILRPQFTKLLKQVTTHLSSVSNLFVHDGAVGSMSKCDAKVRVVSDILSAVMSLSSVLWKTSDRAVSHDTCPLTVYVATSISVGDVGLGAQANSGFIAADPECSSLILCGNAFSDLNSTKEALAALSGPIISARGGLPLSARLLASGDSSALLFVLGDAIKGCWNLLVSADAGVVLSSKGIAPFFQTKNPAGPNLFKIPTTIILAISDSSGSIPPVSKLSPGQAAYHFLAGYQNGKFMPAYTKFLCIDELELSKAFLSKLKDHKISCFLVNTSKREKSTMGKNLEKIVEFILSTSVPHFEHKGRDLQAKYDEFLSGKCKVMPEEFAF